MSLVIRAPAADEADALTGLCLRSKASWGYDDAFMAASRAALTVTPKRLATDRVWVAQQGGRLVGVVAVVDTDLGCELDLLFVEPELKGSGIGRMLMNHVAASLRARGVAKLVILSDPNAEAFYRRCGAVRVGEAPSDAIADRLLPLLVLTL